MSEMVKKCSRKVLWFFLVTYIWLVGNLYLIKKYDIKTKYTDIGSWLKASDFIGFPNWLMISIPIFLAIIYILSCFSLVVCLRGFIKSRNKLNYIFCLSIIHVFLVFKYDEGLYLVLLCVFSVLFLFSEFVYRMYKEEVRLQECRCFSLKRNYLKEDKLDRVKLVDSLVSSIENPRNLLESLVVGIKGGWGAGKTHLMRMIEQKLNCFQGNTRLNTIWFDPWKYDSFKELKFGLLNEIVKSLNGDKQYGFLIFSVYFGTWLPFFDKVLEILPPNYSIIGNFTLLLCKDSGDFENRKKQIASSLKRYSEKSTKLVVFIDDLDRTAPKLVSEFFGNLNQLLNIKGICYILGLEENQITSVIKKSGFENGELYLEKVIHRNIYLQPSIKTGYMSTVIDDIMQPKLSTNYEYKAVIKILKEQEHFVSIFNTPRALKRYLESLKDELVSFNFSKYYVDEIDWSKVFLGYYIKIFYGEKEQELIAYWCNERKGQTDGDKNNVSKSFHFSESLSWVIKKLKDTTPSGVSPLERELIYSVDRCIGLLVNFFEKEKEELIGAKEIDSISPDEESIRQFLYNIDLNKKKGIVSGIEYIFSKKEKNFNNYDSCHIWLSVIFDDYLLLNELKFEIYSCWFKILLEAPETDFGNIIGSYSRDLFVLIKSGFEGEILYDYYSENIIDFLNDDAGYFSDKKAKMLNQVLFEDTFLGDEEKMYKMVQESVNGMVEYEWYYRAMFDQTVIRNRYSIYHYIEVLDSVVVNKSGIYSFTKNTSLYFSRLFELDDFSYAEEPYRKFLLKLWGVFIELLVKETGIDRINSYYQLNEMRETLIVNNKIDASMFLFPEDFTSYESDDVYF